VKNMAKVNTDPKNNVMGYDKEGVSNIDESGGDTDGGASDAGIGATGGLD
jgi:hypothetical protein